MSFDPDAYDAARRAAAERIRCIDVTLNESEARCLAVHRFGRGERGELARAHSGPQKISTEELNWLQGVFPMLQSDDPNDVKAKEQFETMYSTQTQLLALERDARAAVRPELE